MSKATSFNKRVFTFAALVLALSLLTSCVFSGMGASMAEAAGAARDWGSYSAQKPLNLKFSSVGASSSRAGGVTRASSVFKLGELFKEKIEAMTDGAVRVTLYSDGVLGNDRQSLDGVIAGVIELAANNIPIITNYAQEFQVLDLPFLFRDYDHAVAFLKSDVSRELADYLTPKGARILTMTLTGMRGIHTINRFVPTLDAIRGLKIRVTEGAYYLRSMTAWGAAPQSLSQSEVLPALSTGALEATELAPANLILGSVSQTEFIKYLTISNHVAHFSALTMNNALYESLTPDLREAFDICSSEAGLELSYEMVDLNQEALQVLTDEYGCQYSFEFDKRAFEEAVQPMIDEFKSTHPAAAYYDRISEIR